MDIKSSPVLIPHTISAYIRLICNDQSRTDRICRPACGFIMITDGRHDRNTVLQRQIFAFQKFICQNGSIFCMAATVHCISNIMHKTCNLSKLDGFLRVLKFLQNQPCPLSYHSTMNF